MSFDKNQYNQVNNQITPKTDNINKEKENNVPLKPIAIKQNILANNPPPNNINKFQNASIMYQNQPTNQYLKEISQMNYFKAKDNEIMKYNSGELPSINSNEKGAFSSFYNNTNNNINSINNINNNNTNKINYLKNESMETINKIHCTCKKTKCIKKYCECYSSGVFCKNCKCENCENCGNKPYLTDNNNNNNNNIIKKEEELNENKTIKQMSESEIICDINDNYSKKLIICTCSKSGCNKNYCECFKAKVKCNNKCRCIKCLNKPDETIPLDEEKPISKSVSTPINNNNNNNVNNVNNVNKVNNFTVHRISVKINKKHTEINIEKLDYFDSNKFLSKKRSES